MDEFVVPDHLKSTVILTTHLVVVDLFYLQLCFLVEPHDHVHVVLHCRAVLKAGVVLQFLYM